MSSMPSCGPEPQFLERDWRLGAQQWQRPLKICYHFDLRLIAAKFIDHSSCDGVWLARVDTYALPWSWYVDILRRWIIDSYLGAGNHAVRTKICNEILYWKFRVFWEYYLDWGNQQCKTGSVIFCAAIKILPLQMSHTPRKPHHLKRWLRNALFFKNA